MRLLAKASLDRWEFAAECRAEWGKWRRRRSLPSIACRSICVRPRPRPRRHAAHRRARSESGSVTGAPSVRPVAQHSSEPAGRARGLRNTLREVCDDVIDGVGAPHRLVMLVGPAVAARAASPSG